jgi:hypothetical protein
VTVAMTQQVVARKDLSPNEHKAWREGLQRINSAPPQDPCANPHWPKSTSKECCEGHGASDAFVCRQMRLLRL